MADAEHAAAARDDAADGRIGAGVTEAFARLGHS
jgi:hypothetical protein